ncbi:MAG: hypothetical protein EPN91_03745 [Salinibacterium sp.]|nr:MAG: hypothetical protein EPN91_03745 [Salinibacterium sp.]
MARFRCPTCLGVYIDPQPEGSLYFHVCPPLSLAELVAMPAAAVLALYPSLPPLFTPEQLAAAVGAASVTRAGARNENIVPGYKPPFRDPGDTTPVPPAPAIQDQPPRILLGNV